MVLVLDECHADEIAQVGARIPSSIVGIHVDFSQLLDHLSLIRGVGFRSRGCCCQVGCSVMIMVAVGLRYIDRRERKSVGDLEICILVHSHEEACGCRRESLGTVFDDLHDHQRLDLYCLERDIALPKFRQSLRAATSKIPTHKMSAILSAILAAQSIYLIRVKSVLHSTRKVRVGPSILEAELTTLGQAYLHYTYVRSSMSNQCPEINSTLH